jgi:putative acetyltransferase
MITPDDPRRDDVRALLETHLALMHATSPPEDVHALDIDGLTQPSIRFYSYRVDGALLAIGALKQHDSSLGELKSMHTSAAARGQGIGRMIVEHLLAVARSLGLQRVSLETGSQAEFEPARALYARAGFVECEPFADYAPSVNSTFMTRSVDPSSAGSGG